MFIAPPLAISAAHAQRTLVPIAQTQAICYSRLHMPTLLIADDHPLFRAALHRAAEEAVADLQISEADSLDGVLDVLERQPIDLMLLDLHMPGNHGLAGLATIRALQPGLAIITSAYRPMKSRT